MQGRNLVHMKTGWYLYCPHLCLLVISSEFCGSRFVYNCDAIFNPIAKGCMTYLIPILSTTIYLWLISLTASKELPILLLKLLE